MFKELISAVLRSCTNLQIHKYKFSNAKTTIDDDDGLRWLPVRAINQAAVRVLQQQLCGSYQWFSITPQPNPIWQEITPNSHNPIFDKKYCPGCSLCKCAVKDRDRVHDRLTWGHSKHRRETAFIVKGSPPSGFPFVFQEDIPLLQNNKYKYMYVHEGPSLRASLSERNGISRLQKLSWELTIFFHDRPWEIIFFFSSRHMSSSRFSFSSEIKWTNTSSRLDSWDWLKEKNLVLKVKIGFSLPSAL